MDKDLLCVDSLDIFKKIDETASTTSALDEFMSTDLKTVQKKNEKTPSKSTLFAVNPRFTPFEKPGSARRLFVSHASSPKVTSSSNGKTPDRTSYKLIQIYQRLHEYMPDILHNAEADTVHLMLCAIAVKSQFVQIADSTAIHFNEATFSNR